MRHKLNSPELTRIRLHNLDNTKTTILHEILNLFGGNDIRNIESVVA